MASPIDRSWYQRPPGVRERLAAGGVVLRKEGDRLWVALVREEPHPEAILPKGGVKAGETLEQAARREIREEAGLGDLVLVRGLGPRSRLTFDKRRWTTTHYFLFLAGGEGGEPTDKRHAYRVSWHPLDALPELLWPEQVDLLRDCAMDPGI